MFWLPAESGFRKSRSLKRIEFADNPVFGNERVHYALKMALSDLTPSDREVVKQCIELIVDGPYLLQSELQTRTGLT